VQQAWEYAVDAPGVQWVLVSNCLEIRLYRFGRGRDTYEKFDLTQLDDPDEHRRLFLVLGAKRFLGGDTEALLVSSDNANRDVTNVLYSDYSKLRNSLIAYLIDAADGPRLERRTAIELAQKLLDRVLFIAFSGGTGLMPPGLLDRAAKEKNAFRPEPVWTNFQRLFNFVDRGSGPPLDIWAYNGGLFAPDPVLDGLILPDHLAAEIARLGQWDFGSEVPVTVLGHIFEQSITDLEALRAEARNEAPPRVGKRKREGVVYTPDHITRFLVEHTLGATMAERFAALLKQHTGKGVLPGRGEDPLWPDDKSEAAFWRDYLDALSGLTVLDPACGSGAFLVAAFDVLAAEYLRVIDRLETLGDSVEMDAYDQILEHNLYGVDLNIESVEITRLSLWLKTARRKHRLASLDETIRDGNSLIADARYSERPFAWDGRFAAVAKEGGFDIVIGNPPYVRMELLKSVKPYLAQHYAVADERTDLYAYFFEKAVKLLKPGGRLGFISSSTFFRTGSGEKLRLFLSECTTIETVIDFGDAQVFEGVTTYPAILTLRKLRPDEKPEGCLRFLKIGGKLSIDLGTAFDMGAQSMARSRLTGRSWQLEEDRLARLREKIVKGRKTLGDVHGQPLYGIKTGLNDAFIVDTGTRDRLVARDPKSSELLKPFLRGENIKRWCVEPEGLFLINIPRGKVRIDDYPAIRDHLLPFREALERRATDQQWFELQQAQLAYQEHFDSAKIAYQDICNSNTFCLEESFAYLANTCYFIPNGDSALLGYLNSKAAWYLLAGMTNIARGGYLRLRSEFVEKLALPNFTKSQHEKIMKLTKLCTITARDRFSVDLIVRSRIFADLGGKQALSRKLEDWHALDFAAFRAEVKRAFKADIPVKERAQWESYLKENAAKVASLSAAIAAAEREIDELVYQAFDLTPEEIALLESSLAGQA
jgi:SAM-dependent methyltransferase